MRLRHVPLAAALAAVASVLVAGEASRSLRLEYALEAGQAFTVENLVGTMRVQAGSGSTVEVEATVHAESEELADLVRLEKVRGDKGEPVLRVVYPLDDYRHYRRPPSAGEDEGFWQRLGRIGGGTSTTYLGRRVKVDSGGVLLYAEVEVRLPRAGLEAAFRNIVGPIHGRDVEGDLLFDGGSGDITLERVRGTIKGDTGSGDVKAVDVSGSYTCDTGSGDCDLTGFDGDRVNCDTGSGDVRVRDASARIIRMDTGSGDVKAAELDAEELDADTGSGNVDIEVRGGRLTRVRADTGSGDVTLRLPHDTAFEATADQGSGDLSVHFDDAQPIVRHKEVIGYRRGDGRVRILVDTGSGDCVIQPASS